MDEPEFKSALVRLRGLLDPLGVPWAVAAGSAVYLYTRNRPPADLDVLVPPSDLEAAGSAMKTQSSVVTTAWGESEKVEIEGIEVSGPLTLRVGGDVFRYAMDGEMAARIRSLDYSGTVAPVLAPEDIVAFKAVLQRGPEQGKHDLEDIDALISATNVDVGYLLWRLRAMGAVERAMPVLSVRGLLS